MFKYLLYKFGLFILYRIPVSISYKIACFISDFKHFFSFIDKKAVKNNLKNILILDKSANLDFSVREVFRNFGRYLVEFFMTDKMVTQDYIKDKIELENIEYIDQVLEKEKGAILLTAHIGNWEMGAIVLSMLGYPVTAIALPHKETSVNALFNHQRESKGLTIVPSNIAVRKCLETLGKNKIVALVGDRDFTGTGKYFRFLGKEAIMPRGAAMFSYKTGAAIIPVFLIRKDCKVNDSLSSFVLSVGEPIYPPKNKKKINKEAAVLNIMKSYISIIEKEIRKNPAQWMMFREFWKK